MGKFVNLVGKLRIVGIAEEKGGINLNKMPRALQIVISASKRIAIPAI